MLKGETQLIGNRLGTKRYLLILSLFVDYYKELGCLNNIILVGAHIQLLMFFS